MLPLVLLLCAAQAPALDPAIPAPASIIGHPIGEGAVRYEALVRYLEALDKSSDLVTLTRYGATHEGRALYYLTITSPANHQKLDRIKSDGNKLADPRLLTNQAEADRILRDLPGVAWLAYSIHGDELSSTDAAIEVAYRLAAGTDAGAKALREQLVIHVDPLMNPDGRERYLAQLQALRGSFPNPDYQAMQHQGLWSAGRGNHYLFDLNRDWLAQVHPETRGRTEAIRGWNPLLVVDSHEMGPLDTYLFDPPREPINIHLDPRSLEWRRRFSADQAAAFDRHGWSYYTREWYEEWYPGYTNAWAGLRGAVGILYEQASVNATAVKQATGGTLTYAEAVAHHVASSFANLETLRANREAIARDFLADRRWAVSSDGPLLETFLLPPGPDAARRQRLLDLLMQQGIEHRVSEGPIDASDVLDVWGQRAATRTLPAGTVMVDPRQPLRRLVHAILGFDPHMPEAFLLEERKELESRRESRIYDITGWSVPMAFGLEAYWARAVNRAPAGRDEAAPAPAPAAPRGAPGAPAPAEPYGYLIDGRSADIYAALAVLFEKECKPRVADKPFSIGGQEYLPGTVLLRRHENPAALAEITRQVAALGASVRPAPTALATSGPDLGGQRFVLLQPPRVALASQWPVATTSFGSAWYLLDGRYRLRVSPINIQNIRDIDLRAYNVLVVPDVYGSAALAGILDEPALGVLKRWVEAGGTLVAIGGAAAFVADEKRGLSSVRLRQNALDQLEAYQEALAQEQAARRVKIDPESVWGPPRPPPSDAGGEKKADADKPPKPEKPDLEAARRSDEWARIFSPQGAIVAGVLDPEHWLCFGLPERLPVMIAESNVYMSRHPAATPLRLAGAADLRLGGLLWPEARARFADSAWATVERVGNGQVVLFAFDPFFRGYWEGSARLLGNAVLLGPGMGAKPPIPW